MGEHRLIVEHAWRMFEAGQRDRAYQVADEVLALDPFDYRACELRLAQLIEHDAYAEARRLCLQLQTANPVSGWLWEQRCRVAQGLGHGPDLVESARAWLRSEPNESRAYLCLAQGHQLTGDEPAARAALRDGQQEFPDDADLVAAEGDWHLRADDHASARRAYRRAQLMDPGLDLPEAPRVFDSYLDLTLRTLLVSMMLAVGVALPARLGIGGFWGGLVALGLVGAAGWAHREWFGRMRAEVPEDHLAGFVRHHPVLVATDAGALAAGAITAVLAFVTDLGAQQVGAALVVATIAVGAGIGLLRRARTAPPAGDD